MNGQAQQFDVVIAGGGMTGAMLAYTLLSQSKKLRIAIIEQSEGAAQQAPAVSFDSRSIALSAGSVDLLSAWGLWSELAAHACPITQIHVSDRGHFGKTRLDASSQQRQSLGQVIEIEWLGAVLYPKLAHFVSAGRLVWFRPDHIVALQYSASARQLELASGQSVATALLILCEGGDSPTRHLAGCQIRTEPYGQSAVIANVGLTQHHRHCAFERFTCTGPIALLPLTRQRYSLVWTLSPEEAAKVSALDDLTFLAELQQAFGYRAGVFQSVGQRQTYPLQLKYAQSASAHRLLLCGNSLHNLHPIAGQGFNLAMRDIHAILALIGQSAADPGSYQVTRQYDHLRQQDMARVVQMTDAMVRLFSQDARLVALGRNIGLTLLDQCSTLKHLFARQTMGLAPLLRQQTQLAD